MQDDEDASCMYLDYQIRGFFKSALNALEYDNKIKQAKSKVDKFLFIAPRKIHIFKDGKRVYDTDEDCERSLRAETMQGPRTTVAASEQINAPWEMTFTVRLIQNSGSKSSAALTFEAIEDALDYGQLCGLGQWRNGGHGGLPGSAWTRRTKPNDHKRSDVWRDWPADAGDCGLHQGGKQMTLGSLFDGSGTWSLGGDALRDYAHLGQRDRAIPHPGDAEELPRHAPPRRYHADQRRGDRAGGYRYIRLAMSGFERGRGAEGACRGRAKLPVF